MTFLKLSEIWCVFLSLSLSQDLNQVPGLKLTTKYVIAIKESKIYFLYIFPMEI